MTVVDNAKNLLTLAKLNLPSPPKIEKIEVEAYVDHTGEDALTVLLILNESTTYDDLNGDATWAIDEKIHDSLLKQGIYLFPYTRYAKQSEIDEIDHIAAEGGDQ